MSQEVTTGCEQLVMALDEAVALPTVQEITESVQSVLCDLIVREEVQLPATSIQPDDDSYARRLLHRDPQGRYSVLAMIWGPEQGTPLHDHDGLWCVEGVLHGRIEVTQYRLTQQAGSRYQFVKEGMMHAGVGSSGLLIPPFDYHTISNAMKDVPSVTIHVYGGDMDRCSVFEPLEEGWYQKTTRELALTA